MLCEAVAQKINYFCIYLDVFITKYPNTCKTVFLHIFISQGRNKTVQVGGHAEGSASDSAGLEADHASDEVQSAAWKVAGSDEDDETAVAEQQLRATTWETAVTEQQLRAMAWETVGAETPGRRLGNRTVDWRRLGNRGRLNWKLNSR